MFSIKYAPSLYPGMTLRKHPNVHNTKGSKMSFKEILKKKVEKPDIRISLGLALCQAEGSRVLKS